MWVEPSAQTSVKPTASSGRSTPRPTYLVRLIVPVQPLRATDDCGMLCECSESRPHTQGNVGPPVRILAGAGMADPARRLAEAAATSASARRVKRPGRVLRRLTSRTMLALLMRQTGGTMGASDWWYAELAAEQAAPVREVAPGWPDVLIFFGEKDGNYWFRRAPVCDPLVARGEVRRYDDVACIWDGVGWYAGPDLDARVLAAFHRTAKACWPERLAEDPLDEGRWPTWEELLARLRPDLTAAQVSTWLAVGSRRSGARLLMPSASWPCVHHPPLWQAQIPDDWNGVVDRHWLTFISDRAFICDDVSEKVWIDSAFTEQQDLYLNGYFHSPLDIDDADLLLDRVDLAYVHVNFDAHRVLGAHRRWSDHARRLGDPPRRGVTLPWPPKRLSLDAASRPTRRFGTHAARAGLHHRMEQLLRATASTRLELERVFGRMRPPTGAELDVLGQSLDALRTVHMHVEREFGVPPSDPGTAY